MNAQVFFDLQLVGHSVGDVADAQLDGRAILHQRGHIPADRCIYLRIGCGIDAENVPVGFHQRGDLGDVHHCPGVVGVHLHQQDCSGAYDIHFVNGADGQRHIASGVHGGHGSQQHRTAPLVTDTVQRLAQNTGGVLRHGTHKMLGVGLTQPGGEEPAVVRQDFIHLRIMECGIVRGDAGLQDHIFNVGVLQML